MRRKWYFDSKYTTWTCYFNQFSCSCHILTIHQWFIIYNKHLIILLPTFFFSSFFSFLLYTANPPYFRKCSDNLFSLYNYHYEAWELSELPHIHPSVHVNLRNFVVFIICTIYKVPTLPGKSGIVSFTFPGRENAWNLLKKVGEKLEF